MIPIGDDAPTKRPAFVTWALIAVNLTVFVLCVAQGGEGYSAIIRKWGFSPGSFSLITLITSMFLHAGPFHVLGNMLYLWVFGDNVEDEFGHVGFLFFYLGMGVLAALTHALATTNRLLPMVGASGAISGILGAYALLFPRTRVKVVWWIYWYVRVFKLSAGWLLGFYFVMQAVLAFADKSLGGIAYWAHMGGFVAGAAVTAGLLAGKLIKAPAEASAAATGARLLHNAARADLIAEDIADSSLGESQTATGTAPQGVLKMTDRQIGGCSPEPLIRISLILSAISNGKVDEAVQLAQVELRMTSKIASSPWDLARVADAFYQKGIHPMAFQVYREVFRRSGEGDERLPEMKYRAGVIASRHLHDFNAARELLGNASRSHESSERRASAKAELTRIEANLARTGISEDGGLLSGPCALVRQTDEPINIAAVGRLVSEASGRPMADATRLLKGSVGFVCTELEPVVAKQLATALQDMDIPVLVIPQEKLIALPPADAVARAGVFPEGLSLITKTGADVRKAWSEIFYASAAMVGFTSRKRVHDEFEGTMQHYAATGIGYGAAVPVQTGGSWRYKDVKTKKLVFDVFTLSPFSCYRLTDGDVNFTGSPQAATHSASLNYKRLITDFVAHGRQVPVNDGVELVAAGAPRSAWRRVTFGSVRDYERYNYWRLQLEQYG